MGNCLVKKLKGVVDNDNLSKFGELRIKMPQDYYVHEFLAANKSVDVSIIDGALTFDNGTTASTIGAGGVDNFATKDTPAYGELSIADKYSITAIAAEYLKSRVIRIKSFEEIRYCPLVTLACIFEDGVAVPITELAAYLPNLEFLSVGSITGTIDDLVLLTHLRGMSIQGSAVTGTFDDLGKLPNVENYAFSLSYPNTVSVPPIRGGSIETFVANKRLAGKTEGSSVFMWLGDPRLGITWKGAGFSNNVDVNTISWTANTITFRGETITA